MGMPERMDYDPAAGELRVGEGVIAPVPPEVWNYEVSGMRVVRKWLGYRKRDPEGRRSSPLDDVNAERWEPAFATELLELLNVLALVVQSEATQTELLDRIMARPLITADGLVSDGILPVADEARRPPAAPRLMPGEGATLLDGL